MSRCIEALEASQRHFQRELFGSRLSGVPVITVQRRGQKRGHGWYAHDQWTDAAENPRAELNVCAEDLLLGPEHTLLALLHEMVHQRAHEEGIRDTSKQGRYHNRRFKELTEDAGLLAPDRPDPRTGYAQLSWGSSESRAWSAFCSLDSKIKETFVLARRHAPPAAKGKMLLFVCACTPPYKIRTGRADFSARCMRCEEAFRRKSGATEEVAGLLSPSAAGGGAQESSGLQSPGMGRGIDGVGQ